MSGRYRVGHDDYRDDRKFVMNLEPCGGGEWLLTTYRNTGSLPPVRQDRFASREEAAAYVRKWEPTVPVISCGERSLELNPDGTRTDEEVHADYELWLDEQGLFGVLSLNRHVPYFWDSRGWTEKRRVVNHHVSKEMVDGREVSISETSDALREV